MKYIYSLKSLAQFLGTDSPTPLLFLVRVLIKKWDFPLTNETLTVNF